MDVVTRAYFETRDIGKDASKLVCQIGMSFGDICASIEDGSEAAFVTYECKELHIVKMGKVSDSAIDQSVIVKVKVPKSVEWIYQLVHDDGGKLHARHNGCKISLFDPSTKEFLSRCSRGRTKGHSLSDFSKCRLHCLPQMSW